MQFTTLFVAASALFTGINAVVIPRDGARLAQFRVFGADGCHDRNMGFYTIDQSDIDVCHTIDSSSGSITSVTLEVLTEAANGCSLNVYSDAYCSAGEESVSLSVCTNPTTPGQTWESYKIVC
ncbi:hypothetical protein GGS21DRAFT_506467 [Xylaria nigripes]|nr:hypothetical protein GGS21DRAFT_506467 [Xylaria nigripes]